LLANQTCVSVDLTSPDMHYGDGMMREEIERVRKRAEAASSRKSGYSYQSPLGNGFSFDKGRPMGEQTNPFSRRRPHRTNSDQHHGDMRIEYEESYFDMNGDDFDTARRVLKSKERIVERMNVRRKNRERERGEPNPYLRRTGLDKDADSSGCAIM
jgi:hypothetical protein